MNPFTMILQLLATWIHKPAKKTYRLKPRPMPVRVKDSIQIFELARALGNADAALVVWTLRGWLMLNEAKKQRRNYRDGRWWTYNSLEIWCQKHFQWLTARRLGTVMARLEEAKVIIRCQYEIDQGNPRYWYTVDQAVLDSLIARIKPSDPSDESVEGSHGSVDSSHESVKTIDGFVPLQHRESSIEESSTPDNNASTPTPTTARTRAKKPGGGGVAAADQSGPEPESGEYPTEGEGPMPPLSKREPDDAEALPLSPSSGQPLSPSAGDLVAEMVDTYARFDLTEDYAARLIHGYGEDHVRAVHEYVQQNWRLFPAGHQSRIFHPPGFMTDELANRRMNLPPVLPPAVVEAQLELERQQAHAAAVARRLAELEAREQIAPPAPIDQRACETWHTAHHQLSLLFDAHSFNMWLKHARLLGYADGLYTVGVPTAQAQDMLQHRYNRNIVRVVEGLHGHREDTVSVQFQVWTEPPLDQMPLSDDERDELAQLRDGTWADSDNDDAVLLRLLAQR